MTEPQFLDGLIIDSFAGGGGASTAIEWALGRSPDFAINHDPEALAMHQANHPETVHLTENIWKVNPHALTKGRKVSLLWASPDCRHHSKAKGGAPVSRSVRGLADVILVWAHPKQGASQPEVICLENVEEFADWGPLGADGRPCPNRKGHEFRRWVQTLESFGYEVQYRQLRACDFGAPTIRKRLFLVARRDGKPILWPAPTHGDPASEAVKSGTLKPWRTAAEIIDWSIKCPSIFLTKDQARDEGLKVVRPLAPKTMARIARGFKRYVLDRNEPFIVSIAHGDSGGRREYPLSEPHRTVTTGANEHAFVLPYVSYAQQGGANRRADAPMHTVCASIKDQNQVVVPFVAVNRFDATGKAIDTPMPTITANSFIKRPGAGGPISIIAPFLAQHNTGVIGRAADEPAATITTTAAQVQPVFGYLAPLQSQSPGAAVDKPMGTVCAAGNHHTVISAPFMAAYYGTGEGAACDDPLRTVTTRDRFALVDCAGAAPPFDEAKAASARQVAAFLRAEGVWDGKNADGTPAEFVTVGPFIVYDIGMRMLTARELARAQGFPDRHVLAAPIDDRGNTLSDTAQRHKIGNSVSPYPAAALLRENMIAARSMPATRRKRMAFNHAPPPAAEMPSLFAGVA